MTNTDTWIEIRIKAVLVHKYYHVAGQQVAMRADGVVYWLHGDHLGSTSLATDADSAVVAQQRYEPYGEPRWASGPSPTDLRYTGQRAEDFGLMDYHARYYHLALGRFISPDTIVPSFGNPQSFNRYSYVYNRPLNFLDPSGHDPLDEEWQAAFRERHGRDPDWKDRVIRLFSIAYSDEWDWSAFYDAEGSYIEGSLETVLKTPGERSWAGITDALDRLASWYDKSENRLFTRDIGTLFGGLPDRFKAPNAWHSVSYRGNPAQSWVHVSQEGIPPYLLGIDPDANIHHWAWGLTMGAEYGIIGSFINEGRELCVAAQVTWAGDDVNWANVGSDILIGNAGAAFGFSLRVLGPYDIRQQFNIHMTQW